MMDDGPRTDQVDSQNFDESLSYESKRLIEASLCALLLGMSVLHIE